MQLVVNANVLFSFFNADSTVRDCIIWSDDHGFVLFTTQYGLRELWSHRGRVMEVAGIDEFDFILSYCALQSFVTVVQPTSYTPFKSRAEDVFPDHTKDWPYLALCFKLDAALWSNEKRLQDQDVVDVYDMTELYERFLAE